MIQIRKIYTEKGYNEEVVDYMEKLCKKLDKQYGEIKEEWRVSLDMIAFNYNLIVECQKDILLNGIDKEDSRGRLARNPAISTMNISQNALIKLLNSFGLNLMSKSKLGKVDDEDDGMEDLLA
jgi:P27 family predicted phage terminase small subunit